VTTFVVHATAITAVQQRTIEGYAHLVPNTVKRVFAGAENGKPHFRSQTVRPPLIPGR
jgi:hypothetical protein